MNQVLQKGSATWCPTEAPEKDTEEEEEGEEEDQEEDEDEEKGEEEKVELPHSPAASPPDPLEFERCAAAGGRAGAPARGLVQPASPARPGAELRKLRHSRTGGAWQGAGRGAREMVWKLYLQSMYTVFTQSGCLFGGLLGIMRAKAPPHPHPPTSRPSAASLVL